MLLGPWCVPELAPQQQLHLAPLRGPVALCAYSEEAPRCCWLQCVQTLTMAVKNRGVNCIFSTSYHLVFDDLKEAWQFLSSCAKEIFVLFCLIKKKKKTSSKTCTESLVSNVYYTWVEKCSHSNFRKYWRIKKGSGQRKGREDKAKLYLEARKN